MTKRMLPFGYRMEMGRNAPYLQEAEIVISIFQSYAAGASYGSLTDMLNDQPVEYSTGRRWNKQMIARIMADERYIGDGDFPSIIDSALWAAAQAIRATKQPPEQPSELRCAIRKYTRDPVNEQVEAQVTALLKSLLECPEGIRVPATEKVALLDAARLQAELKETLNNEKMAKQKILQIAAAKYSAIGNDAYETMRLKRIFTEHDAVNAELIRQTVSGMEICDGRVLLRLRNGQIIEKDAIQ